MAAKKVKNKKTDFFLKKKLFLKFFLKKFLKDFYFLTSAPLQLEAFKGCHERVLITALLIGSNFEQPD